MLLAALAAAGISIASADPITGSISFIGTPTFDNDNLADATSFTVIDHARVSPDQQTGDYAAVANNHPVTFTAFRFVPPTPSLTPLWTFDAGGLTYSFDATSMISSYNADLDIWNIGGRGIAHITGFDDTYGTWNFSAGKAGDSFYFGSAMVATGVPDGASTAALLTAGCVGLAIFRRPRRSA